MHFAAPASHSDPDGAALRLIAFAAIASAVVLVVACATSRAPLSSPLSDFDLARQITAGSDALLERMVIPPNRPDWVLMDCSNSTSKHSAYDRVRHALCEAAGKSPAHGQVTSTQF